jgi:hypothetical protein
VPRSRSVAAALATASPASDAAASPARTVLSERARG